MNGEDASRQANGVTGQSRWTDAELAGLRMEGLEFLIRLQSGIATQRDEAEFLAWRGQSQAHEEAFRSAYRLQQLARTAEGLVDQGSAVVPFRRSVPRVMDRRVLIGGGLAASAAAFTVWRASSGEQKFDYRTAKGERRLVQLADGVNVDLNTRTSIAVLDDVSAPAVELLTGELILTTPDRQGARAILVAGKGTSVARSGAMCARRDGDRVSMTCLAGTVDLTWRDQSRTLKAAQQIAYDDRTIGAILGDAKTHVVTAWRSGLLIFSSMPMSQVIAEINRYRPGRVVLANPNLADRPLSGAYDIDRLDEFFDQARLAFGVSVTRLPGDIVILR